MSRFRTLLDAAQRYNSAFWSLLRGRAWAIQTCAPSNNLVGGVMGDGPVAVRTRSGVRRENASSRTLSKGKFGEPSRRASKRKLATQIPGSMGDAERNQETEERDEASPNLLSVSCGDAEPRGGKHVRELCNVELHSRGNAHALGQPGDLQVDLQDKVLKRDVCDYSPDSVLQVPVAQEISRCLRRRIVVWTCERSADPIVPPFDAQAVVRKTSREPKSTGNSSTSSVPTSGRPVRANGTGCQLKELKATGSPANASVSVSERRAGANGVGCQAKEVIKVTTLRKGDQSTSKIGEMQNTSSLSSRDQREVQEEPKPPKGGDIVSKDDGSSVECKCKPATGKVTQGSWDPTDSSHLLAVKSALHLSAVPETILCRESEQSKLIDFCKACVTEGRAGSMYICGCPGTGKSLTVEKIKSLCGTWSEECPETFTINCTSLTEPRRLYSRFLQSLRPDCDRNDCNLSHDLVLKQLKRILCGSAASNAKSSCRKMVLLIVDEMDYLITRDQSVLYDLFRLTSFANSRLILLGIANAIDLTDRLLPKLRSMTLKVEVLTFPTYNEAQILAVLHQRLLALPYSVFQPAALELCARRVAAAAGDMRKALHVCRSAVEVLEAEARAAAANSTNDIHCHQVRVSATLDNQRESSEIKRPQAACVGLTSEGNAGSQGPRSDGSGIPTAGAEQNQERLQNGDVRNSAAAITPIEVRIDAMARALSRVFRSPIVETIQSLPRHQQLVLCAAVRQLRLSQNCLGRSSCGNSKLNRTISKAAASTNLADLHSVYLDFCRSSGMAPLAAPEFSSVCQVLSDQALLVLGSSREDRLRKVGLKVDAEDVIFAMQGVRYLKLSLLQ